MHKKLYLAVLIILLSNLVGFLVLHFDVQVICIVRHVYACFIQRDFQDCVHLVDHVSFLVIVLNPPTYPNRAS